MNKSTTNLSRVEVRDSDKGEILESFILNSDGTPYDLSGKSLVFNENKDGDKFVSDPNVTIVDARIGHITYQLHDQVHSAPGTAWFDIIQDGAKIDSTTDFYIEVRDGLKCTVYNTTYISDLEKLKRQMEALIQQADGELKAELQKAEQQLNQELQNFRTQYNSLSADFQNQFKTAQNARQQDYNNQKNAINADWTNNKGEIWGQWNSDKASIDKQAQDTVQAIKDNAKQVLDKDQADWNAKQKQWDSTFSAIVKEWQVKTNSLNATVQDLTNKFNTIIGQVSDLMNNKIPTMNAKTDAAQKKIDELRANLSQVDWTSFARKTDTTSGGFNIIPFAKDFKNLRHWELQNTNDPNGTLTITRHSFYQNGARNLLRLSSHKHSVNMDQYEVFARSDFFQVKPHTTYTFSMEIFGDINVSSFDVFFLGYNSYSESSPNKDIFDNIHHLLKRIVPNSSRTVKYTATFTTDNDVEGYIRIDNNGANKDNVIASLYICWVKLEEGTQATTENRSQDDYYDKYDIDTRISNVTSVEAFEALKNSVLLKKGDNMQKGGWITWNGSSANSATDGHLGGIQWTGATDNIKIFGDNNQADNLDLAIQLSDDNSNHISFRDKDGTERAAITADGHFTGSTDWAHVSGTGINNPTLGRLITNSNTWNDIIGQDNGSMALTSIRDDSDGSENTIGQHSAGIAFGGGDTKGVLSVAWHEPHARIIGGNGNAPVWKKDIAWKDDLKVNVVRSYNIENNQPGPITSEDLGSQWLVDQVTLAAFADAHRDVRNHTDYRYPTDQAWDTAINLNSDPYLDTGIYKIGNCTTINGPWDQSQRCFFYLHTIKYDYNTINQIIIGIGELYFRSISTISNTFPAWNKVASNATVQDLSDKLQSFTMQQAMFQHRVDYESPSGTISNQTVDFNNYRETGILKVVNCLIQNGPYKSEYRHTLFLKITNLDGQTQYQTVYEGDNLYGRKLYNGSGQWHKYTNTPI